MIHENDLVRRFTPRRSLTYTGESHSMLSNVLVQAASAIGAAAMSPASSASAPQGNFLDLVNSALKDVSATQKTAGTAEAGYAAGVQGATIGNALVSSDRAEVAWN